MSTDMPSEVRSNDGLGLSEWMPLHEAKRLAELWTNGCDFDNSPQWRAAMRTLLDEIERLRADVKAMEGFADLWYFVSDEAPLEFEKIVAEYSPGRWLTEAHKLRTAKRGA